MAVDTAALQAKHPTWNIIRSIPATDGSGGIWALMADGGVANLDANGDPGPGAAKYFGSYAGLAPNDRQGDRQIVDIVSDPETGGYTLISNRVGQNYRFVGDKPIGGPTGAPAPAPTPGIDFTEADQANMQSALAGLGVGDLFDRAWNYYLDPKGGGGDQAATLTWLETTPEFETHFPGLKQLREKGQAITPGQWSIYYNAIQEEAVSAGLPPGMIDREDIGKMLVGGVSKNEAIGRISAAGQSVYNADPALIQKMRDYGMTDGDLTAFYLDPDKAAPLLERKAQEGQARIGAALQRGGYDISLSQAKNLQTMGVDEQEAEAGAAALFGMHPLFENTIGETTQGSNITTEEQLAAQFGNDLVAQQEIDQRRKTRQANFQGGGGAATGGAGRTGLG